MSQTRAFIGQGSNSALVGDFNARVILTALRRCGQASKADLSRLVGLTNNATGVIARKLESGGLVRSVGKRHGERGQPATILELNPEGAFSIGVRIDRTMIETVLVDLRGEILDSETVSELPPPGQAVAHLAGVIGAMADRLKPANRMRLSGIGVAAPYNLEAWLQELGLPAARFEAWRGFDIQSTLQDATGFPVVIENDGSAAAVGELIYGRGREINDFLYVFIGPAIGGGIVMGGDYVRGPHRNAGDIGVVPVGPSRLASAPKPHGPGTILLARASLAALQRHLRFHRAKGTLAEAIASRPDAFAEWCADAVDALALPVLTSAHLLDVRDVVLGSDMPQAALEQVARGLAQAMAAIVAESRTPPAVHCGLVGPRAGAIGAASLPLHDSFSPVRDVLTAQPQETN